MISHDVIALSEQWLFVSVQRWYEMLVEILKNHHCTAGPLPEIHTDKGRGFVEFTGRENGQVYFTWHKMPSGKYEIVCYRS